MERVRTSSSQLLLFLLQLIGKLEEKCSALPSDHQEALSAEPDQIMYSTPGDVGIFYDDDGTTRTALSPVRFRRSSELAGGSNQNQRSGSDQ